MAVAVAWRVGREEYWPVYQTLLLRFKYLRYTVNLMATQSYSVILVMAIPALSNIRVRLCSTATCLFKTVCFVVSRTSK